MLRMKVIPLQESTAVGATSPLKSWRFSDPRGTPNQAFELPPPITTITSLTRRTI
ncbi:Hypothetical protein FKW44_017559 [Caligus rogercresseyi]|uniref:Uncharacterized protein n=1 Tax=Caligus rogercresseyi TaxID=217165 RepID=A0A7T8JW75_CALRO|nr:Hypothetical protein FKW44_017559 [Caligus rogercresseyi]